MALTTTAVALTGEPQLIATTPAWLRLQNRAAYDIRILYATAAQVAALTYEQVLQLGEVLQPGSVDSRADMANRGLSCWAWVPGGIGFGTLSVERDQ